MKDDKGNKMSKHKQYEIRNCSWGYRCEQTWDTLITTDSPVEKYCDSCERRVYLCDTLDDLASVVAENACAAFSIKLIKPAEDDEMVVGDMQVPPIRLRVSDE
ncbi:hypothetical protein [Congregibacter litoralis]|uniref:Uncharacterized protein n=1 Tax=Congregibacter litoralis KT71 TaxID=314285 RepID=A4AB57_9GAMM|nr:hypothetical protein [Congregibacter litoralis]EAQ96929.1 hypothetical protein KT71_11529 [Congregibacter litoralis KT71]